MTRLKNTLQMLFTVIIVLAIGVVSHVNAGKAPGWMTKATDDVACLVSSNRLSDKQPCS